MKKYIFLINLFLILISSSLKADEIKSKLKKFSKSNSEINFLDGIEIYNLDNSINVVVEIPSGSIEKWELNETGNAIELNIKNNNFRYINYLGYPANYGFIPKTLLPVELNGDGDAVDVIILGKQLQTGQVVRCNAIGMLNIKDQSLTDNKVICVEPSSKLNKANSLKDLKLIAPGILEILEIWFNNYKGESVEILNYSKRKETFKFINDASKHYSKRIKN